MARPECYEREKEKNAQQRRKKYFRNGNRTRSKNIMHVLSLISFVILFSFLFRDGNFVSRSLSRYSEHRVENVLAGVCVCGCRFSCKTHFIKMVMWLHFTVSVVAHHRCLNNWFCRHFVSFCVHFECFSMVISTLRNCKRNQNE